jgi:hypothetical protein
MARENSALVWNGCIQLIGFAGYQSFIFQVAERYLTYPENREIQWYISDMMLNGCSLRAVEPLLKLHDAAIDRDARRHIEHCLSILLEEDPEEIYDGPEESEVPDPDYPDQFNQYHTTLDRIHYFQKIRSVADKVAQQLAYPTQPVMAGMPLDLQTLTRRLYDHIRSGAEGTSRMEWMRMFFEASTGIDSSDFYDNYRLQRLAAMAVLEDFFDSGDTTRFSIGTRYFFGYPIER